MFRYFFILLALFVSFAAHSEVTTEEKLAAIYSDVGHPVPNAETLPITKFMQGVVDDLTSAARDSTHRELLLVNHLHVVESPELNAFVTTLQKTGIAAQENHVFVTSGLVRAMLALPAGVSGDAATKERTLRLKALTGIIAHEMGHPVDLTDKFSLEKIHGERRSGQIREVRADFDGTTLLRAGRYPPDAIYVGKQVLFGLLKDGNANRGLNELLGVARSSHPEAVANQTMNRLILTFGRLEQGLGQPTAFAARAGAVTAEDYASVSRLPAARSTAFTPAPDLASAIRALDAFLETEEIQSAYNKNELDAAVRRQYNRLVLTVEKYLTDRPASSPLGSDEMTKLTETFREVMKVEASWQDKYRFRGGSVLFSAEDMKTELAPDGEGAHFFNHPSHRDMVERAAFFRSPEFLKFMSETANRNHSDLSARDPGLIAAAFMPAREYFNALPETNSRFGWKKEHAERVAKYPAGYPGREATDIDRLDDYLRLTHDFHSQPLSVRIELGAFLLREAFLDQSDSNRTRFIQGLNSFAHGEEALSPAIFLDNGSDAKLLPEARRRFLEYLHANPEIAETYRQAARYFWDNKGKVSVLGLSRNGRFDWQMVAALTGDNVATAEEVAHRAALDFVKRDGGAFLNFMSVERMNPEDERKLDAKDRELLEVIHNGGGVAGRLFARQMIGAKEPARFREWYAEALHRHLSVRGDKPLTTYLRAAHDAALAEITSKPDDMLREMGEMPIADIIAEGIVKSPMSPAEKQAALHATFIEFTPELHVRLGFGFTPGTWAGGARSTPGITARVVDELVKSKHFPSASAHLNWLRGLAEGGFWKKMKSLEENDKELRYKIPAGEFESVFPKAIDELWERLRREIAAARSVDELVRLAGVFGKVNLPTGAVSATTGSRRLGELQAAMLKRANEVPKPANWLPLYSALTQSGVSLQTDALLHDHVLPGLAPHERTAKLEEFLRNRSVYSRKAQTDYAREVLRSEVDALAGHEVPPAKLKRLVEHIEELVPERNEHCDQMLEDFAWKLRLSRPGELNFIESHKSTNLQMLSPHIPRWISMFSNGLADIGDAERTRLLKFMSDPKTHPFGPELDADLRKLIRRKIDEERKKDVGRRYADTVQKAVDDHFEDIKRNLVRFVEDLSANERIPIFDLLLHLGAESHPAETAAGRLQFVREHLGTLPDSRYEKSLMTYLDLVPEHERSVTLSYLLAHRGEGDHSLANMFSAFRGPGIRAGQQSALWDLVGADEKRELAPLFDRARPETLAEITARLHAKYPDRGFRIKKLLGSATSLTAVEVEWDHHGEKRNAALLMRRPHALEQLETMISFGTEYIARLRAQGLESEATFVKQMIDAQSEQMRHELDFGKVASNLEALRETVEGKNGRGGVAAGVATPGVKFRVPKVYRDLGVSEDMLFIEMAPGTTFQRAAASDRARVGKPLANLLSRLIFDGAYQANPSPGNFLVSGEGNEHTVWLIDGGQVGRLGSRPIVADEGYHFARLLMNLRDRNAKEMLKDVEALGSRVPAAWRARAAIESEMDAALKRSTDLPTAARNVLDVLTRHGIEIDTRLTFNGGLKTILEMLNSGILPPAEMEQAIEAAVQRKIVSKPLPLVAGEARKIWSVWCGFDKFEWPRHAR